MSFKDELVKFGKTVVKKGTELGKIAKLKLDISGLNEKIKNKKIEIADVVIEKEISSNNKEIKSIIDEINDLKSRIKVIETQIKDIETNNQN